MLYLKTWTLFWVEKRILVIEYVCVIKKLNLRYFASASEHRAFYVPRMAGKRRYSYPFPQSTLMTITD